MNLLLIRPEENQDGQVELLDRRATHLMRVLRVVPGSVIRVGIVGKGITSGTVLNLRQGAEREPDAVHLRLGPVKARLPPSIELVLALPRPKALSRTVQAAASFGIRKLTLINAWRVEKSYFSSPRLTHQRLQEDVWLGCEQGAQVHLPEVELIRRFTHFTERASSAVDGAELRVCLHPRGTSHFSELLAREPVRLRLVIGPEGGFIEEELESLARIGFHIARMATGPLRTEVALAAALGQASVHFPDSGRRSSS